VAAGAADREELLALLDLLGLGRVVRRRVVRGERGVRRAHCQEAEQEYDEAGGPMPSSRGEKARR